MKGSILASTALCATIATATFEIRQTDATANLQFEISANTFTGANAITLGKALDITQNLVSINVGKSGDKEVLCQAFSGVKPLGAFFTLRELRFTAATNVTRIECDLPKFPVINAPSSSVVAPPPANTPASSSVVTSATTTSPPAVTLTPIPPPTGGSAGSGSKITFQFETEFATTFVQRTFPFGTVIDLDENIVSAKIQKIVDAAGATVDASKVVCKTQKDNSSTSAGDITALDKTFFDRRNPVKITQISCSGLDGKK